MAAISGHIRLNFKITTAGKVKTVQDMTKTLGSHLIVIPHDVY